MTLLAILLIYLMPILGWILYTYPRVDLAISWPITLLGGAILAIGSALFYALIREEHKVSVPPLAAPQPVPSTITPIPLQSIDTGAIDILEKELEERKLEIIKNKETVNQILEEKETLIIRLQTIDQEWADKESLARKTIETLEQDNREKEQAIEQLENQIHDLRYEIKTVLQMTEVDRTTRATKSLQVPPSETLAPLSKRVSSPEEALRALRRCIQMAERISGGYHTGSSPSPLDLRRLIDLLRQENGFFLALYAPKEQRLLFASKETKTLFGWNSEPFIHDFFTLIEPSYPFWQQSLEGLVTAPTSQCTLQVKTKDDSTLSLNTYLGAIPAGLFRSLVLVVGYTLTAEGKPAAAFPNSP